MTSADFRSVRPTYEPPDISWLEQGGSPLPAGFLWGVANAGYQVEGGYNGPGQPRNNWAPWEQAGRVEPSGAVVRFWDGYARHFDLAEGIGLNAFRLSLEWTRLQPFGPGEPDAAAVAHYADILAAARERRLEPVVTLHHFTHPAWLGADPWVDGAGPAAFASHVVQAVAAVGRALIERGQAPVRWWITLNEPNIFAFMAYLLGQHPHEATSTPDRFRRALDQLMTAHVLAYRSIHATSTQEGWDRPSVGLNTYAMTAYPLDRGLHDLQVGRETGATRLGLAKVLQDGRERFLDAVEELRGNVAVLGDGVLERTLLPFLPEALPSFVNALYDGDPVTHDFAGIDYYVGPLSDYVRSPFGWRHRDRQNPVVAELWETTIRPEGLRMFVAANDHPDAPKPVLIAENGMCTQGRGGMNRPRADGWTRPAFIRAHVAELLTAARAGHPVAGYLHWTLVDNYEWGSYEPRFGLFGVDRQGEEPVILSADAQGMDAAGAYRDVIAAVRAAQAG